VIGRVFRLVRALSPNFAHPDDQWAQNILSAAEFTVFSRMDARDREHAIRVTKKLIALYPDSSLIVQRAALLHDCGKSIRPYNVIERVLSGIIYLPWSTASDRMTTQPTKPFHYPLSSLSAMQVKRLHPQIGQRFILEAGGDAPVAEIVGKHHRPGNDFEAQRIHEVDELE
jgi:hypothetical protein